VTADELCPLLYLEDDPIGTVAKLEERHLKEYERLKHVRIANDWAKNCTAGFLSGTRVEAAYSTSPFDATSSPKTIFLSSWTEIVFLHDSLDGVLSHVCEVQCSRKGDELQTHYLKYSAGCLRPVFWDVPSPLSAAKRAVRRDAAFCTKSLLRGVYRHCSEASASTQKSSFSLELSQNGQMSIGDESLFSSLGLPEVLLQSLQATCQTIPQRQCLPFLMQGRDVVCVGFPTKAPAALSELAVTYLVPALCKLDVTQSAPQVLILVPNTEWEEAVKSTACTLGASMHIQSSAATPLPEQSRADPLADQHIIIGVPEQIQDFLAKGVLKLENIKMLVIHNVVEMDALCDILAAVPRAVQCCVFSASRGQMYEPIRRIMHDEVHIFTNQPTLSLETSRHFYVAIEREEWKLDTLCDVF